MRRNAPTADITGARIQAADAEPQSWLAHGRTYSEPRFSPLAKITTADVARVRDPRGPAREAASGESV